MTLAEAPAKAPASGEPAVVELSGNDQATLRAVMEELFGDSDWLCAAEAITPPQLFVSDMDSTMIGQECIDELADYAGIKPRIAAITERAMRGELDFEAALRERVALLEGLEESAIERCLAERIRPSEGAHALIAGLKANGVRTVLVTGGFHHFADAIGAELGFDRVVGNTLEVEGGRLTGRLLGAITDAAAKARLLAEEAAVLGEGAVTVAIGDGANDIPMIAAATHGFAYRAKPAARSAADGRIESGDLRGALALLGLTSEAA